MSLVPPGSSVPFIEMALIMLVKIHTIDAFALKKAKQAYIAALRVHVLYIKDKK
jgi:hypothetical protein